jgi:hypothetical protein
MKRSPSPRPAKVQTARRVNLNFRRRTRDRALYARPPTAVRLPVPGTVEAADIRAPVSFALGMTLVRNRLRENIFLLLLWG